MGNILSPWRYDVARQCVLSSTMDPSARDASRDDDTGSNACAGCMPADNCQSIAWQIIRR
jgi:hypothetical protein